MNKIILILAVLLTIAALAWAGETKELDNFHGIKWGQVIPGNLMNQFKLAEDRGDTKVYTRIGEAAMRYTFYKNMFSRLDIEVAGGDSDFYDLRESRALQYGYYEKPDMDKNEYVWDLKNLKITLAYNYKSKKGLCTYIYKPLSKFVN